MANPKEVLFGPVIDEQKDYWQKDQLRQRDASVLDNHFNSRSRGGKWKENVSAYSIPKSQKVALRESRFGGIPIVEGGESTWEAAYLQAQNKINQGSQVPDLERLSGNSGGEVDIGQVLQNRMIAQATAPGGQSHGPMPGHMMATGQQVSQQPSPGVCTLQEGHTFYHALKIDGFGTTQPLAKTGGTIRGLQGRQFQIEAQVSAYVIDGLQTIDLSKMEPSRLRNLVRVSAPLLGTFLVPQEAIAEMTGGPGSGKQLLIDSGQQHRVEQLRQQQMLQQQRAQQGSLLITQPQQQRPMMPAQPSRPTNPQEILQQQGRDLLRRRGLLKG